MKYKYNMLTAQDEGEKRHPQTVILEHAPDATALTPESVFDCWTFEANEMAELPKYITPMAPEPKVDTYAHKKKAMAEAIASIKTKDQALASLKECAYLSGVFNADLAGTLTRVHEVLVADPGPSKYDREPGEPEQQ